MRISSMFHSLVVVTALLAFSMPFITRAQQDSELSEAKGSDAILLIGDHQSIDEADARSAALLVALELRKLGISVSDPVYEAPTSASAYRVIFGRLGEKVIVRLSQETPIGTLAIERQLLIANIEEMIEAAPRLVDALVHNKPIASTVDMGTVTETEARVQRRITGESHWNVGFFGAFVPGTDINGKPGYRLGWSYELPAYAVEVEGRFVASEESHFVAFSTGGFYFFNKQNISPYVGGGITASNASHEGLFDRGMGIYAVGGIQMLRTTRNRLKLELRVDRPFYSLGTQDMMPISFGLFFSTSGCLALF